MAGKTIKAFAEQRLREGASATAVWREAEGRFPGRIVGLGYIQTIARRMQHKTVELTIGLPPEFLALCGRDGCTPGQVINGFIADLCALPNSNGSDERRRARDYYNRVGYPYWNQQENSA